MCPGFQVDPAYVIKIPGFIKVCHVMDDHWFINGMFDSVLLIYTQLVHGGWREGEGLGRVVCNHK